MKSFLIAMALTIVTVTAHAESEWFSRTVTDTPEVGIMLVATVEKDSGAKIAVSCIQRKITVFMKPTAPIKTSDPVLDVRVVIGAGEKVIAGRWIYNAKNDFISSLRPEQNALELLLGRKTVTFEIKDSKGFILYEEFTLAGADSAIFDILRSCER
jgi:hypothetical protein